MSNFPRSGQKRHNNKDNIPMDSESCKQTKPKNLICDNITSPDAEVSAKSEWIDISTGVIEALTPEQEAAIEADLNASFFSSNPHTVKRGSLLTNPLKTKGPQKSNPLQKSGPKKTLADVFAGFKFDWVQGVIPNQTGGGDCIVGGPVEEDALARAIRFFESIGLRPGQQGNGGKGYRTSLPFTEIASKEKVASIASGSRCGGMPNISMSGGRGFCEIAGPRMLAAFPGLRITRVDTALDLSAPDAFNTLYDEAVRFTRARRMTPPVVMGSDTPEKGRTVYIGSRESQVYARIYEKGLQLAAAGETETDPEWVRIEFVFQNLPSPKKAGFGKLTPGEMVRAFVWPRMFIAGAAKVIGLTEAMERADKAKIDQEHTMKTLDTTADYGADQYAKTFTRLAQEELIRERFNGNTAAAALNPDEVARLAAEIFYRRISTRGKVEKTMETDRVEIAETPAQRANAYAARQQAERLRGMNDQARAANRLALTVAKSSKHADAIEANKEAARKAQDTATAAEADIDAIKAEWAVRQRKADEATAYEAAAYAAFNDTPAPAYQH